MPHSQRLSRAVALAAVALAAACTDHHPVAPGLEPPDGASLSRLECTVAVAARSMTCAPAAPGGVRVDRLLGGQNLYVLLASSGTGYDPGTEILHSEVTVQNLLAHAVGTTDGVTASGLRVFFATEPTVTSGSGSVSVGNPDGYGTFTAAAQPYFHYGQILQPYQVSAARRWEFQVEPTVATFSFAVYVSVTMVDEGAPLLDAVWTGAQDGAWSAPENWRDGSVPDSASVVSILSDTLITGPGRPVLDGDVVVAALRVGAGTTLDLQGHALEVRGNLDAPGAVVGGTVTLSEPGSLLRGNVDGVRVTAGVALQGATRATGAVAVQDGSLAVSDRALSIQIP
jgi:hypothetical protein